MFTCSYITFSRLSCLQFQINIIQCNPAGFVNLEVSFDSLHRHERNSILAEQVIDHGFDDLIGNMLSETLSRPIAKSCEIIPELQDQ